MFTAVAFVLVWGMFAAWLRSHDCEFDESLRGWLELANGATWPGDWPKMCMRQRGHFAVVLATRTALNFAGPLLLLATAIWLWGGGLERLVTMNREQAMRQLSSELVVRLYTVMRKRHPELTRESMQGDLEAMRSAALEVADGFAADVDRDETQKRNESGGLLAR